ncbi:hypothetical protein BX600DRAFT_508113 [Xylariales sp. PMI_506]|nr:hypothetical protein BX600DRAFT_508113 [Xylariales sp. PMI_506]
MSNDRDNSPPYGDSHPARRGSVTTAALSSLFQRSNSISSGSNGVQSSATSAMARDQRRRLSVTTLGLSGAGAAPSSATGALGGLRRGSISTNNSDSIDENAVDDDEPSRTAPTTPFARRMSFGANAMRSIRAPGGTSPGSTGRPDPIRRSSGGNSRPPPSVTPAAGRRTSSSQASIAQSARSPSDLLSAARPDQGFNWSEQLRSRAESSVSGMRPSFAAGSPPRNGVNGYHDRAKSISDMPAPPQQAAVLKQPKQPERPKPDAMQERILKGDFYMD